MSDKIKGRHILVGLSGGVDSSVTAALLRDAGARVTGVFIKGWYPPGMPCTWREDRADAMRAAARLGIPFHTLDASVAYKSGVIDYLIEEYRAGRTPNPDVMCNREVKFGAFIDYANTVGADGVATGHYAQLENSDGVTYIKRGVDPAKDQSYFLWAVSLLVLQRVSFPLGGYKKDAVRRLAHAYGLPQATKADSQGICFLGSISVDAFLRNEFGEEVGEALTADGAVVGQHHGALLHTIGARVALTDAAQGPWYIVAKDIPSNTLIVARTRARPQASHGPISLRAINTFATIDPAEMLTAQYRYHGPRIAGHFDRNAASFTPAEPLNEPIATGQSLVMYRDELLVAGGIMA